MATASAGERRVRWFCLAALAVALPAAILVHSRGDLLDLLREAMREPVVVERGEAQPYGGADWRMTELTRLPGELPGTVVILAEFEAAAIGPARLREAVPCVVALTDDRGRRWEPVFLTEPAVRRTRPDALEKPRCGAFEGSEEDGPIMMAESFLVPEDARGLSLSVALAGASPDRLLFR